MWKEMRVRREDAAERDKAKVNRKQQEKTGDREAVRALKTIHIVQVSR